MDVAFLAQVLNFVHLDLARMNDVYFSKPIKRVIDVNCVHSGCNPIEQHKRACDGSLFD